MSMTCADSVISHYNYILAEIVSFPYCIDRLHRKQEAFHLRQSS